MLILHYILMNITASTPTSASTTTVTSKNLDDMDAKELLEEAIKELQEIKRLLGINK